MKKGAKFLTTTIFVLILGQSCATKKTAALERNFAARTETVFVTRNLNERETVTITRTDSAMRAVEIVTIKRSLARNAEKEETKTVIDTSYRKQDSVRNTSSKVNSHYLKERGKSWETIAAPFFILGIVLTIAVRRIMNS